MKRSWTSRGSSHPTPPIHASSAKGKVALTGTITSGFERLDAVADALRVAGVDEVDDELIVNRPPAEIKASIEGRPGGPARRSPRRGGG